MSGPRLSRDLHPGAWWLWAMGLAAAATGTTNPLLLLMIVAIAAFTVSLRRSDHPWSRSFRLYLMFGLMIVVIRVLFRVLLGGGYGSVVLVEFPEIPLPQWVAGIRLLGPITLESVLAGLYEGLRLATIVICVGAANALANPKRLLKSCRPLSTRSAPRSSWPSRSCRSSPTACVGCARHVSCGGCRVAASAGFAESSSR